MKMRNVLHEAIVENFSILVRMFYISAYPQANSAF